MSILNGEEALGASKTYTKKEMHKVYKPAGSKTVAELTSSLLVAENLGNVYNISDSGVTTSDFVEGAGHPINAGDNVDVVDVGSGDTHVYKFDLYMGADLSSKADKVTNATSGHLAGLDSNGNLTDSGVSPTEEVTVEGNPVTFESPFEQDAKSVVVSVKPIQDLHGYDHPWVGGAGKNKLPLVLADIKANNTSGTWNGNVYSINGGTIEVLVDNADNVLGFKVNGRFGANSYLILDTDFDSSDFVGYYVNGLPTNGSVDSFMYRVCNQEDFVAIFDVLVNDNAIANVGDNLRFTLRFAYDYSATNVMFYPMIRASTESATFAPYSNICPISGIDELEIGVSGGNVFDGEIERGAINSQGQNTDNNNRSRSTNYIPVIAGHKYIFEINGAVSDLNVYGYDSTKAFDTAIGYFTEPFTIPSGVAFIRFYREVISVGDTVTIRDITNTTTIPLPSTLYDADVDVTNGDADDEFGFIDGDSVQDLIDLGASTTSIGSGLFAIYFPNFSTPHDSSVLTPTTDLKCNEISNVVPSEQWEANASGISINNQGHVIFTVKDITTQADMNAWLTANPIQIAYKLATPTTLSFTPTDVELLEGTNVVSTNAEKVAVTYGRSLWQDIDDLKTNIEGKLNKSDVATIEGDTASRAYSVNEFMLRSDGLYKVTQPIASGASITASNTTKTTIGAVLTALLNA